MDSLFNLLREHRHTIAATIFLLVAVFLMLSVRTHAIAFRTVQELVLDLVGPVQRVVHLSIEALETSRDRFSTLEQVREENASLRLDLERRKTNMAEKEELLKENRRLRTLLNMRLDPVYMTISGRVVGTSSSAFARSLILNAGKKDGVRINTPVISADGLVGKIVEIGEYYAVVLTLLDLNSRTPVRIQRNRIPGIATGANDQLINLEFVAKDADVQLQDLVITSGIGGVFPRGLVVGRVVSFTPQEVGLFQKVTLAPAVDFDRLEEVSLLLNPENDPRQQIPPRSEP
ncbi:MAG: rod shape-determining protein MreC [Magnetococcales bacterium]|nr:rod shape-determining protein MreC [Magnetococcales bacterium]MBF0322505.1 rod shape-determining protein MreC [Magnetococcales bacterium]